MCSAFATFNTKESNPNLSNQKRMGYERIGFHSFEELRRRIYSNVEYQLFLEHETSNAKRVKEIADIIVETLCSTKDTINIGGEEYPADVVKNKLLEVKYMYVRYVLECLDKNTTYVRNIKRYLLTTLFNAPSTMDSYYAAQVNHDSYHGRG